MEELDFVHLAWHVLYALGDRDTETDRVTQVYEDDFIKIDASGEFTNHSIDIHRKAFIDLYRPHLRVDNVVTMVTSSTADHAPEVIRHHGEHIYIVPHMLWLIENCEPYQEFYTQMVNKYPSIVVMKGM